MSQQAAYLGVGRLIARLLSIVDLPNLVQYDSLLGPASLTALALPPRDTCYSVTNGEIINAVRSQRARVDASRRDDRKS